MGDPELVLLFDGTCDVSTRLARWARRRDTSGRLLVEPNQARGALARFGVSRAEADRGAWVGDRAGLRWEGAAAISRVLRELGGAAGLLGRLMEAKPIQPLAAAGYRWFARNRSRFRWLGVRPECDEPGSDCE
ncbi:MAG TPA: DUF393 domain-containing protein [Candidatus Sulfotelmatobacter sp.]|nr:DUF393 domain-containing protein [Candidatus Sulfotelmatobacter sp.]